MEYPLDLKCPGVQDKIIFRDGGINSVKKKEGV